MANEKIDSKNEPLLEEIRGNFKADRLAWNSIREEGQKDIRYLAGDPWSEDDKKERKESGRPLIALDELNQYVNQLINNVRESKRGITVVPKGKEATDKLAEIRQGIIREIEYKSKAQSAYVTAFEGAAQRGYGFLRIGAKYVSDSTFDQELVIRRVPNPDTVLMDPECKELDCSDANRCTVLTTISKEKFAKDYRGAKTVSFTPEDMRVAPDWVLADQIQVAEYWKVKKSTRDLVLVNLPKGPMAFYIGGEPGGELQVLPAGTKIEKDKVIIPGQGAVTLLKHRPVEIRSVCEYVTNGIEILDEVEWPGSSIPIIPMFGKELYVDDGGGAQRVLMSLIRLARDPYKLYCYYRSQECEEATLSPKVPWVGYEGQFEDHEKEWANAHKDPVGFLQAKVIVDAATGQILPLPARTPFVPNFQAYEVACEGARRAIQAAIGISPLPTSAQRLNDKSGVALEKIQSSADHGSFHFIDNYDIGLETTGRQLNEVMKFYYDTAREVGIRADDDTHSTVYLNQPYQDKAGNELHHPMDKGEFDVTLSTGPSYDSQRQESAEFVNTLVQNIANIPQPGTAQALILSKAIRMRNLGPVGDELADILDPPSADDLPPQAKAAMAKMQGDQQHMQALIIQLQKEKEGKVVETQGKMQLEQLKANTELSMTKMKFEHDLAMAEINTKAQISSERAQFVEDMWKQFHGDASEAALQAKQHAHEAEQASAAQEAAAAQPETAQQPEAQ